MHIAIDDTYGPNVETGSKYVTGDRRTHVAVLFPDDKVEEINSEMSACLSEICSLYDISVSEFHFVDIYNRNSPWDILSDGANLRLFELFSVIYQKYKWEVVIQTVDDRTMKDLGILKIQGQIGGLDLSRRADFSLLMLLIKIKKIYKNNSFPINFLVDEGVKKSGAIFGCEVFHDWPHQVSGVYASSSSEPLLQIADFIAFCVNRSTHLSMKSNRSDIDNWFLNLVGHMGINCVDLVAQRLSRNFSIEDFDDLHMKDRVKKGSE